MYLIIVLCIPITVAFPNVTLKFGSLSPAQNDITENQPSTLYENGQLSKYVDYDQFPLLSCCPNNLTKYKIDSLDPKGSKQQYFIIPLIIQNNDHRRLTISQLKVSDYFDYQHITVIPEIDTTYIDDELTINLIHECDNPTNTSNYWSILNLQLKFQNFETLEFQYQFICNGAYHPSRFDWSSILLIIFNSIIVIALASFGKIYSFRIAFITPAKKRQFQEQNIENVELSPFQGFYLYWPQAIGYVILLLIALYVSLIYLEKAENILFIIIYTISFLCSFHLFNELFGKWKNSPLIKKILCLKIRDYLALLFSGLLLFFYIFFEKPWFLSNLISICIMGSLIKLFKITSIKNALLFFIPIMIADIYCSLYLGWKVRYEWDSLILRYFNTPISAQLPFFDLIYKKKCAWVSIFNLLFPGFFLGYVIRFDKYKSTYVYEIVAFSGFLLGLLLWVIIQFLISFPLPTSIFTEILMIAGTIIVAVQRNEYNIFYTGNFYDQILNDPFKNEVVFEGTIPIELFGLGENTQIIKREQDQELVITNTGNGIILNSQLFQGLASTNNRPLQQLNQFRT